MKISVAICTYNGEYYLEQQLNSILCQTTFVDEIIICDDCSSDSTVSKLKNFQKNNLSVLKVYFNQSTLGPVKNFEKAISLCTGEIIFLSDQDDVWKPNKVERIIKKFEEPYYLEAIFTNGELINEKSIPIGQKLWDTYTFNTEIQSLWLNNRGLSEIIYNRNKITGATLAIRKSLYNRSIPFPELKGVWHDAWLGVHAAANKSLGWIDEPLIQYRIHATQQVGIGNGETLVIKNKNIQEKLLDEKKFYSDCILIVNIISNQYPHLNKNDMLKEALEKLSWIDYRLNLPKAFFPRLFNIFCNISLYKNYTYHPYRSILRDIIRSYIK